MPPSHLLVGRERELLTLTAFLDAPAALPAAVLIEGEAGMGKTTLWSAVVDAAHERAYRVLEARPVLAEASLAFSALGDLLADDLTDALPALPAPQRQAIEAALLLRPTAGVALDQRAVGVAFLGVLRTLAAHGPQLVAIDDVQWLDPASAATVGFALRRLRSEPVAVVLARRTDQQPARPSPLGVDLDTTRIEMSPLSLGAIHALVSARLGAPVPRPALRRLHELSRGNPFYALELAGAWQSGSVTLEPGERLPPNLEALLGERLAALPAPTRHLAAVAAALSRPTVQALEQAEGRPVGPALARAAREHVLEVRGDEVRFTHPLLAASAYAAVSAAERRAIHGRLARIVPDGEERARHLALAATEPNETVAAQVEAAADDAFRRGAPSSAADLIAMARRLTPTDREADRRRRATAEAGYRFEAGETGEASAALAELVAQTAPGPERAALLARQARFRHFGEDVRGGVELQRAALREAGDDARLRVEIEEGLAWGLLLARDDLPAAAEHARSAVHYAEQTGDPAAQAEALAALALTEDILGRDPTDAMERALAFEPATLHLRVLRHPSFAHGYLLSVADELDAARSVFLELRRRADERGDESALAPIAMHLSVIELLAGDLPRAASLADEAYDVALQSGQLPSQVSALGRRALVDSVRGDVDRTRAAAERSLALATEGRFDPADPSTAMARGGEMAIWALGHLRLSQDDPGAAHRYLGPLCEVLLAAGIQEPGELRALPDEIEALAGLGELAGAERLLARLESMAAHRGRPGAVAAAARSRAIVEAASGRVDAALAAGERALAELGRAPSALPFARARCLYVLGATRRRARIKRAAREALEEAVVILDGLGAALWAAKARAELGRTGGRAPATGGLTPTERRAAELVADGLSNKEVASALFVSPKTVEANLSRVYAKLGVQSRTELARLLAAEPATTKEEGLP